MTRRPVELSHGDISPKFEWAARDARHVAWDIETSGLDWRADRIATCQIYVPNVGVEVIRVGKETPRRMVDLLESEQVTKVFHHAPFDLRFMSHHWAARPASVACTKILAKIVHPGLDVKAYSLKPLVGRYVGETLDKSQQVSDWFARTLSDDQLIYAARDVLFLLPLFDALRGEAKARGLLDVVEATFEYLPTRVTTDLRGCGDVFAY